MFKIESGDEIHYAPITGGLCLRRNYEFIFPKSWSENHAVMQAFQEMRNEGVAIKDRSVNYGHLHFHGHYGLVDIYKVI